MCAIHSHGLSPPARDTVPLTQARTFQAFSPSDSPLRTPFLHASLPGLPRPAPSSCHSHSSSTPPTGHLTPPAFAPWCWGRCVQPGDPEKLMCTEGPVATVQSDGERPELKHASSVPLKPGAPSPRSFQHREPGHLARPPGSGGPGHGQHVGCGQQGTYRWKCRVRSEAQGLRP